MALFGRKRHFTVQNLVVCYLITLGMLGFGYPASIISTTLASPAFQEYMQLVNLQTGIPTARENVVIGTTNGLFQAGAFVNTWITCYALTKFGRKKSVLYNAVLGLFGGALCTGAKKIGMFLAGRWFTGMSSWGFLILTPVYSAELSPADVRGFFTGLHGVHIGIGYLIAVCMGRAFILTPGAEQWRAPLGIYLFVPLLMIAIMFVVPESPSDDYAAKEFEQISRQVAIDKTLETSFVSMFTKPSYRKRTLICMFYCFCGQSTAVLVINNYGPRFYQALGYGLLDTYNFQVGWVALAPFFCFVGAALLDTVGRKPLLLTGIGGCCICLIIEAAALATLTPDRQNVARLGVAALFMFGACYNVGVDVAGNVFYAEVFPNHIRHQGVSITNAVLALSDLVYLELTPVAFANIGWKWFLVFACISFVGFWILLLILPETKGLPLEEVGKLFGDDEQTLALTTQTERSLSFESDEKASFEEQQVETSV